MFREERIKSTGGGTLERSTWRKRGKKGERSQGRARGDKGIKEVLGAEDEVP